MSLTVSKNYKYPKQVYSNGMAWNDIQLEMFIRLAINSNKVKLKISYLYKIMQNIEYLNT